MQDSERRQFNRVNFNAEATLHSNGDNLACRIIDLSLHGALITLTNPADLQSGNLYNLEIPLSDSGEKILMELTLAHQSQRQLGLECHHIDLDSITHLRRLVELNLGDSNLLERDFEALCVEQG